MNTRDIMECFDIVVDHFDIMEHGNETNHSADWIDPAVINTGVVEGVGGADWIDPAVINTGVVEGVGDATGVLALPWRLRNARIAISRLWQEILAARWK